MKISQKTINSYESTYKDGYDKGYPSIELVRLEKLFFNQITGKALDFGCGPGTNGIHLLKKGYHVTFCDISEYALKKVRKKIKLNKIRKNYKIVNLSKNKNFFRHKSSVFDYIICFSVFNNLGTKDNAVKYVRFFNKLLKKNGKLKIDSNLDGKNNYKLINKKKNIYTTHPDNEYGLQMFFPNKSNFIKIIKSCGFEVKDVGRAMFKIFNTFENEIIISAVKK